MVVIGAFCNSFEEPLGSTFGSYASWTVSELTSAAIVVNTPVYDRCDGYIDYDISEIEITFRDGNEFETTGEEISVDDWVTL